MPTLYLPFFMILTFSFISLNILVSKKVVLGLARSRGGVRTLGHVMLGVLARPILDSSTKPHNRKNRLSFPKGGECHELVGAWGVEGRVAPAT